MNENIRTKIEYKKLKYWEVAAQAGIADTTFSRWLRTPLSEERKARVLKAIDELTEQSSK